MPETPPENPPEISPDRIHLIPLDEIDSAVLTRDRTGLDAGPLEELRDSIRASGLRMPIEVFALSRPRTSTTGKVQRYGLISGLRRLMAFAELHEMTGQDRYAAIPAFLRPPVTTAEALTAMVEENEIRAGISPWERGRIAALAYRQQTFPTIEEAVARLYPAADRKKRTRLRALAYLADELESHLTAPETLNQRQCLRIAAAIQAGFGEVIRTALEESKADNPQAQWQLMLPILTEAETPQPDAPEPRPGCPRRLSRAVRGLTIRREQTRDGWCLHFTGRDATSWLLDDVFGDIERMYGPG